MIAPLWQVGCLTCYFCVAGGIEYVTSLRYGHEQFNPAHEVVIVQLDGGCQ